MQNLSHGNPVSSRPLAPFINVDGIVCVGGRLCYSLLPFEYKHPIWLAKRSHIALLLYRKWHKVTCQACLQVLTALISHQYWIVSLRSVLH